MQKSTVFALIVLVLGAVGILVGRWWKTTSQDEFALQTSDARQRKGTITLALDSWVGYFPLQSPVF